MPVPLWQRKLDSSNNFVFHEVMGVITLWPCRCLQIEFWLFVPVIFQLFSVFPSQSPHVRELIFICILPFLCLCGVLMLWLYRMLVWGIRQTLREHRGYLEVYLLRCIKQSPSEFVTMCKKANVLRNTVSSNAPNQFGSLIKKPNKINQTNKKQNLDLGAQSPLINSLLLFC